jgi:CxxC motif-containing protein (DUF1111 family)
MLVRLSVPAASASDKQKLEAHSVNSLPEPTYGGQLQDRSIQGHKAEGKLKIEYTERPVTLAGGEVVNLRAPHYQLVDLGYGPISPDVMISPRVAPPMIGLGLLEAVPEEQILANADPDDQDKDGISGKPQRVWSREQEKVTLGRFGWKAGVATIAQQAAEAFAGDIGISSTMMPFPSGDCTEKQPDCLAAPSGVSPKHDNAEVRDELFDLVTFYSQNLAVPPRRNPSAPEVLKGKELFYKSGCADCHTPKFMTGDVPGQPHLSRDLIYPYTDMLLHDMARLAIAGLRGALTVTSGAPRRFGRQATETVSGHTLFLHEARPQHHRGRSCGMKARARRHATLSPSCPRKTASGSSPSSIRYDEHHALPRRIPPVPSGERRALCIHGRRLHPCRQCHGGTRRGGSCRHRQRRARRGNTACLRGSRQEHDRPRC